MRRSERWFFFVSCFVGLLSSFGYSQIFNVQNQYLSISLDTDNAEVTIATVQGDPGDPLDDGLVLNDPQESFPVLRLYNVPIGTTTGGGGTGGGGTGGGGTGGGGGGGGGAGSLRNRQLFTQTVTIPLLDGDTINGVTYTMNAHFQRTSYVVTRWLVFIPSYTTGQTTQQPTVIQPSLVVNRFVYLAGDSALIVLQVENLENIPREIGLGIVMDTQPGAGSFLVPFRAPRNHEQMFTRGQDLPPFFVRFPLLNPRMTVRGSVIPPEGPIPDKVLLAQMFNLNSALWGFGFDYSADPFVIHGFAGDDGFGIYWTRLTVARGSVVEVSALYGLNFAFGDYRRPYSLRAQFLSPLDIQLGDDPGTPQVEAGFPTPNPFNLTVSVSNFLDSLPIDNVTVTVGVPSGFSLPPGEPASKSLGAIGANSERSASWAIIVQPGMQGLHHISVTATATPGGAHQVQVPILIPFPPAQPLTRGQLRMVGFPYLFQDPSPPAALGIAADDLRLAHYDPVFGRYLIFGQDMIFDRLEPGRGYWFRPPASPVTLQNPRLPSITEPVLVPIRKGWNQLANPFPWPTLLHGVEFSPSAGGAVLNFEDVVARGLIRGTIFLWRADPNLPPLGGEYVAFSGRTTRLQPWEGFWLFSEVDAVLYFFAPNFVGTLQTKSPASLAEGPSLPDDSVVVRIIARGASGRDGITWIGVSSRATDGLDRWDLPKPPSAPGGLRLVSCAESGQQQVFLAVDLRGPRSRQSWSLELTNPSGGDVSLEFQGLSTRRSHRWTLKDEETGQIWDLSPVGQVTVTTKTGQPKRLLLSLVTSISTPLRILNLSAVPVRGRGVQISFALTQPASVDVRVLSLTGRTIWSQPLRAGARSQTVIWAGNSRDGSPVPRGAYLLLVEAATEDGRVSRSQRLFRW
ncbi:MAG: DUF2271 domain-containing protein [Armatimonadetes bacterium]|nr:DUF2271 domain-containing protein [Armatimonadota bacterium]MDW8121515.1 hypothetical protein [Armatimonadota bacterium]